jgi:hypothetical protein
MIFFSLKNSKDLRGFCLINFRYRETGASDWSTFPVSPSGSTEITIQRLTPSTDYQFQVVGKNALGDGMFSQIISVQTKGKCCKVFVII